MNDLNFGSSMHIPSDLLVHIFYSHKIYNTLVIFLLLLF